MDGAAYSSFMAGEASYFIRLGEGALTLPIELGIKESSYLVDDDNAAESMC